VNLTPWPVIRRARNIQTLAILTFAALLISTATAHAGTPSLSDVTPEDFRGIVKDFAGLFVHTAAASAIGPKNLQFGLLIGAAATPTVQTMSKRSDPDAEASMIQHASFIGLWAPTDRWRLEVCYLPRIGTSELALNSQSIGVQWTATDPTKPGLDVALKLFDTGSHLTFTQETNGQPNNIRFKTNVGGFMLILSQKVYNLVPYFGVGRVRATGTLKSSEDIFNSPLITVNSISDTVTGARLLYGVEFNIFGLQAGLDVSRTFNANKLSAKFAFDL
jgi:hypothetical protein